jgi:uncharacterized RDD family membrane protein YckC
MNEVAGLTPGVMEVANLWRRLFAFLLDGILLGLLGAGLGLIAFDRLVALGDRGRAIGFAIALVYFGVMDSKLSGGQSLGKRILEIKVVTGSGAPLSVRASTLRAAIFCVPYFLNGVFVDPSANISWLLVFLVFGVGISIGYLLLFNRRTRQSLHDLAAGAYVVYRRDNQPVGATLRIWPVHLGVVGLILATALVLPFFTQRLAASASFSELASIQQGLQKEPDVWHAAVSIGVTKAFRTGQATTTTHVCSAQIFFSTPVSNSDPLADRAVQIMLNRDPSITKLDEIAVTIIYGYDIGIASAWRSKTLALSPRQWRQRISVDPTSL